MCRDRAWRRWRGEVKFRRLRRRQYVQWRWGTYYFYGNSPFLYNKKNSIDETIEVEVRNAYEYEIYLDHLARKNRDNACSCSCCSCCNPRNAGLGNSREVLSAKEGSALTHAVQAIFDSDAVPPNSKWRKRKWNTAARQSRDE